MNPLLSDGFRCDGRKPSELRHIKCRLAPFNQADGSSYVEQGGTKILAAIYGPHEPETENQESECKINVEYYKSPFADIEHRTVKKNDVKSKEIAEKIKNALQSAIVVSNYPKSVIDIYLTVIESDGADWSACVNAAGLALVDAGIVLKDIIAACEVVIVESSENDGMSDEDKDDLKNKIEETQPSVQIMDENDPFDQNKITDTCHALIDPNREETSSYNVPKLSIALLPKLNKIIAIEVQGRLHLDRLEVGLKAAENGANAISHIFDQMVKGHLHTMNEMRKLDGVED